MSMEQLLKQVHDYVESRGTTHQPRAYDMARLIVDLISQAEPQSAEPDEAVELLRQIRPALNGLPGSPNAGRLQDSIDAYLAKHKGE